MADAQPSAAPRPADRPTMYFIGVTTAGSSIMRVFPDWAALLGLGDCALVGIDLPLHAPADDYRRVVDFIAGDPLSLGALVTTHKLDLYDACRDRLLVGDEFAAFMGEASCLSKRDGRLVCHAKDPITCGLALAGLLPRGWWADRDAAALVLGAGGAGTAIAWHLLTSAGGGADHGGEAGGRAPSRLVVTDRRRERLDAVETIRRLAGGDVEVELVHASDSAGNDAALERLPRGSLVINATGLGKDRPGSPLTDSATFPEGSLAWDLNYRGDLVFLDQARAQGVSRGVRAEDGWTYFIHGWSQHIAEVFHLDPGAVAARFDELAAVAARGRDQRGGAR
jgi:shikimate 5-dehydrogenase